MSDLKTNEDVIAAVMNKNSSDMDKEDSKIASYVALGIGLLTVTANSFSMWGYINSDSIMESSIIISYSLFIFSGLTFLITAWLVSSYVLQASQILFYAVASNLVLKALSILWRG